MIHNSSPTGFWQRRAGQLNKDENPTTKMMMEIERQDATNYWENIPD